MGAAMSLVTYGDTIPICARCYARLGDPHMFTCTYNRIEDAGQLSFEDMGLNLRGFDQGPHGAVTDPYQSSIQRTHFANCPSFQINAGACTCSERYDNGEIL